VIASVQINNSNGASNRVIGPGNLRLVRGGTLASNQFRFNFRTATSVNQEFSYLLLALDSGASANPTYTVTAIASNNNAFQGEAKIIAMQGLAGSFVPVAGVGATVPLGAAATTLNTNTASTFPPLAPAAGVAVIASTHYIAAVNAGGPFSVAVGAENIVYNAINRSSNPYQHFVCNTSVSNGECDHIAGALLWLQTFAGGNPRSAPSFLVQSAADLDTPTRINGESKILAIQLEPVADRVEIF
jgi:hypothetical protein